jgi:hypothetical protein
MTVTQVPGSTTDDRFNEVLALIQSARRQAVQAVNTQLIELYWQVGAYISRKMEKAEGVIPLLVDWRSISVRPSRGCVVLLGPICFACVSFTRRTGAMRKSHHW